MSAPTTTTASAPIIIHNHYELRSETFGTAVSFDPTGPAYGSVRRNELGHITHVTGLNATLGWSFKQYLQPAAPISAYRTFGTVGVVVPHIEFGVDYKHQLCVKAVGACPSPLHSPSLPHPHPCPYLTCLLRSGYAPKEPRTDLVVGLGLSWLVVPKIHIGLYG